MRILYLDCFAGVSGDMLLGALMDLGITVDKLTNTLDRLNLTGFRLTTKKTTKKGIAATEATVHLDEEAGHLHHRRLPDILNILDHSALPQKVKTVSAEVFQNLAAAEAKIHGTSIDNVHFHEVGALDAIVDIVGTAAALDILGIDQVVCSPLPLGTGFVECAHGTLPLPAPATLELLRGLPTRSCDIIGETVTPTGAALVKTLTVEFGPIPSMQVQAIGYGAGHADRSVPNLLRAVLGLSSEDISGYTEDTITVVEANIDDMNPEFYDYIFPLLFENGALDVFITPVLMKKGRPAQVLSCLVPDNHLPAIVNTVLRETTALGVRTYLTHRYKLAREIVTVKTPYGQVNVKLGRHPLNDLLLNIAPEWEDCRTAAINHNIPVKTIYDLAKAEVYKTLNP